MREYIDYNDTLREGTDKLNHAIDRAYDADETAVQAKQDVDDTLVTVNDTLDEVNTVKDTAATLLDEVSTTNQTVNALAADVQTATDELAQAVPVGEYNAGTTYHKNNEVSYNGSSYVAKQETVGNPPTNSTYWQLRAQRGVDGEGSVSSVNGIFPDLDGNVDVEIPDVSGLASKAEVQAVEGELASHLADYAQQLGTAVLETTDKTLKGAINEVFQTGNNVKSDTVDALLSVDDSLPLSENSTWTEIISSILSFSGSAKVIEGVTMSSTSAQSFQHAGSTTIVQAYTASFSGLGFTPKFIIAYHNPVGQSSFALTVVMPSPNEDVYAGKIAMMFAMNYQTLDNGGKINLKADVSPGVITEGAFTIPIVNASAYSGAQFNFIAIGGE